MIRGHKFYVEVWAYGQDNEDWWEVNLGIFTFNLNIEPGIVVSPCIIRSLTVIENNK
jgi:hypothetical protein